MNNPKQKLCFYKKNVPGSDKTHGVTGICEKSHREYRQSEVLIPKKGVSDFGSIHGVTDF